jgi:hypothetical protein
MGSYSGEPEFKTLKINNLHPTFAAEVEGVDFQNLSNEQFQEIMAAMAKVCDYGTELFIRSRSIDQADRFISMEYVCSAILVLVTKRTLLSPAGLETWTP